MNHEEHEKEKLGEQKRSSHGGCCGGGGHGNTHDHGGGKSSGFKWSTLILFVFLGIAGFFLFTEHRAHLFGFLPWLLILACPLMHLFHGHGGHGGHSHNGDGSQENKENQKGVQS